MTFNSRPLRALVFVLFVATPSTAIHAAEANGAGIDPARLLPPPPVEESARQQAELEDVRRA